MFKMPTQIHHYTGTAAFRLHVIQQMISTEWDMYVYMEATIQGHIKHTSSHHSPWLVSMYMYTIILEIIWLVKFEFMIFNDAWCQWGHSALWVTPYSFYSNNTYDSPVFVIAWEWHIGLALLCGCSGALEYPTTNSCGPINKSLSSLSLSICLSLHQQDRSFFSPAISVCHFTNKISLSFHQQYLSVISPARSLFFFSPAISVCHFTSNICLSFHQQDLFFFSPAISVCHFTSKISLSFHQRYGHNYLSLSFKRSACHLNGLPIHFFICSNYIWIHLHYVSRSHHVPFHRLLEKCFMKCDCVKYANTVLSRVWTELNVV